MEQLGVRLLGAGGDAPVDVAHIVAGLVDANLVEIHAASAQLGVVQAHQRAALAGSGKQLDFAHAVAHIDQLGQADADAGFAQVGGGHARQATATTSDVEDALHHAVLVDTGRFGLEGQDDAVAQHVEQHRLNVLGADEVASGQPGMSACAAVQGDGAARAGAIGDPVGQLGVELGGCTGGHHQLHQVFLHRIGHVQAEDLPARSEDRLLAHLAFGLDLAAQRFAAGLLENAPLDGGIREADLDVHEEAVELGFGQRVGAFLLDGVLRGHHQEQRRQLVGAAANADLALGHGFEQRGDFVGQHQVVENRPLLEHEAAGFRTIDLGAGDVGRQQVGGELDTVELRLDAFGQFLDGFGLGQARRAFDQHVAVGEQYDQQAIDQLLLAQDLGGEKGAQRDQRFTVFHRRRFLDMGRALG